MGRVNFGWSIHDRKGITEKVEVITDGISTPLSNWSVYNLPVDYSFNRRIKYQKVHLKQCQPTTKQRSNLMKQEIPSLICLLGEKEWYG